MEIMSINTMQLSQDQMNTDTESCQLEVDKVFKKQAGKNFI